MKTVTVITPTYNRSKTFPALYKSLLDQSCKEFTWLVVDDGSEDNTRELVEGYIKEAKIDVKYICQKNQGKHVALNTGIKKIETELTFIVDSDDVLTKDAIETISSDWERVKSEKLCGISYLRGYDKNTCIGDRFPQEEMRGTYIEVRINQGIDGDKAEVWRTDLLKSTPFPVFEGEKFLGEGYVWSELAKQYSMVFYNKILYITEYLEGGLSKSGRAMRIKCPKGGQLHARQGLSNLYSIKARIKSAMLYDCYAFFDKQSMTEAVNNSGNRFLSAVIMPIGYALYKYWNYKYGE